MKSISAMILLLLLSLIAISPLHADAWYWAHDSNTHLVRLNDVSYQMSDGNFYPRWLSLSCLGKGSPCLNFYAPGFYLVTNYLHLTGISLLTALKVVCFCSFFLGAWGMFLWMDKHIGTLGATLSATVYLFAPYHLVDIYVRGALPEFAAIAALPFLFHALDLSISPERGSKGIAFTALSSAAIVLLHNLSALMIFPFALGYFLLQSYILKAPLRRVVAACMGPVLGAGLSAFYWLPLVMEAKYLRNLNWVKSGVYAYQQHFLQPAQLFNTSWGFEPFKAPPTGMSFQLGHILLFCLLVGVVAMFGNKANRHFSLVLLSLGMTSLLLTFSYSSFLYRLFPVFAYIQFPWRFLGCATLFLSAFCGTAVDFAPAQNGKLFKAMFCLGVIVSSIWLSGEQRKVYKQLAVPLEEESFRKHGQEIFTAWTEDDYMPKSANISPKAIMQAPLKISDEGIVAVGDYEKKGSRMTLAVSGQENSRVILPWLFFPGWKASCDGADVLVRSTQEGLVSVDVPPGRHTLKVWFGTTWPRVTGWIIAVAALAASAIVYRAGRPDGSPFA